LIAFFLKSDFNSTNVVVSLCVVFREHAFSTFFGGHEAVVRPDPIPNSAVKRSVADGSAGRACVRVGSRQIFHQMRRIVWFGVFIRYPAYVTTCKFKRLQWSWC
jgi:hypothetical protein